MTQVSTPGPSCAGLFLGDFHSGGWCPHFSYSLSPQSLGSPLAVCRRWKSPLWTQRPAARTILAQGPWERLPGEPRGARQRMGAPQSPGYSPHSASRTTLEGLGSSRWTIFCCSLDLASAQSLDVSPSRPLCLDPGPPHSSWKSTEGKRAWATCRAWRKNNYSSPGSGPVHYLLLGVETEAGRCNHLPRSHAGVY